MENGSSGYPVCPGVALELPVQLTVEGLGMFRSNLVGSEHGRYLLVKMPHLPDLAQKLYQKNHFIIRYLHAGKVYGFRSTLVGMIREPMRLLILSYPEDVESHNTRRDERFDCMIPATVRDPEDPGAGDWKGLINDMSLGGCRFRAKTGENPDTTRLAVGTPLTLAFGFLGEETWQTMESELRSLAVDNRQVTMGLSFRTDVETDSQRRAQESIRGIITSLLG